MFRTWGSDLRSGRLVVHHRVMKLQKSFVSPLNKATDRFGYPVPESVVRDDPHPLLIDLQFILYLYRKCRYVPVHNNVL